MNTITPQKKYLVSVIVPVYNVAPFLKRCVNSITNQTYKNLEIILVDDGSSDGSGVQCDEIATKDSRITVIHQKNAGLSAARNSGINNAHGKYAVFIDSDDYVDINYIDQLLTAITQNQADISLCGFIERSHNNHQQRQIRYSQSTITCAGQELLKKMGTPKWYVCVVAWNKMYDLDLLKKTKFPDGKLHEDEYTTPFLLNTAKKVAIIPECLYNYCKNDQSITGSNLSQKHIDDMLLACQNRANFFRGKNNEVYNSAIRALLDVYPGLYYKASDKKQKKYLHSAFTTEYKAVSNSTPLSKRSKLKYLCFLHAPSIYVLLKSFYQ